MLKFMTQKLEVPGCRLIMRAGGVASLKCVASYCLTNEKNQGGTHQQKLVNRNLRNDIDGDLANKKQWLTFFHQRDLRLDQQEKWHFTGNTRLQHLSAIGHIPTYQAYSCY